MKQVVKRNQPQKVKQKKTDILAGITAAGCHIYAHLWSRMGSASSERTTQRGPRDGLRRCRTPKAVWANGRINMQSLVGIKHLGMYISTSDNNVNLNFGQQYKSAIAQTCLHTSNYTNCK